jgi:hypothetical protein
VEAVVLNLQVTLVQQEQAAEVEAVTMVTLTQTVPEEMELTGLVVVVEPEDLIKLLTQTLATAVLVL